MFTNMALINGLSWYTVTVNQTGPSPVAIATCVIFESILVFLPMAYLVVYLVWYSTGRYHENIKTKVIEWHHKVRQCLGRDLFTAKSLSNQTSIKDADFDSLVQRASEHEELEYGTTQAKVM